jgi:hypothetical protein
VVTPTGDTVVPPTGNRVVAAVATVTPTGKRVVDSVVKGGGVPVVAVVATDDTVVGNLVVATGD